jgi:1,4-dihydroxy-2-naphthoate octaprenyltransferase
MESGARGRQWLRVSRPWFLLGAALLYSLGAGIARYLGESIDWGFYLLGQSLVASLQLGAHYLNEYYDAAQDRANPNRTPFSGGSGQVDEQGIPRRLVLNAALGCLAVAALCLLLLSWLGRATPTIFVLLLLAFLAAIFYSTPPLRLVASGYGELTTSILVANLLPTFSYLLQEGEPNRLLAMSTFPLTLLHLAMMLAFEVPDYAADLRANKRTLMVRVGWQTGMNIHNALILGGYLLLGLAISLGMPLAIGLPAALTFPLGLLQIWQMRRVADGARPNYLALTLTPVVLVLGVAYLLALGFWTR